MQTSHINAGLAFLLLCLSFSTVQVANAATSRDTIQQAYVAYYGRPGDPDGINYWSDQLQQSNGNISAIIDAFGTSPEYMARLSHFSNQQLIDEIYQQLFNRSADPEGMLFYLGKLQSGELTAASMALDIINGAKNSDSNIVNHKLSFAHSFTSLITENSYEYGSLQIANAKSLLTRVSESSSSIATALNLIRGLFQAEANNYSLLPTDWSIPVGESVRFTLTGDSLQTVEWFVNGLPWGNSETGIINSNGLYTAPEVPPAESTVIVRAALKDNPGEFSESAVTITTTLLEQGFLWYEWLPRIINTELLDEDIYLEVGFLGYPNLKFNFFDKPVENASLSLGGSLLEPQAIRTGVYRWKLESEKLLRDHVQGTLLKAVGELQCINCSVGFADWILPAYFSDSTVPATAIYSIAPDIQASSHLINLSVDAVERLPEDTSDSLLNRFYSLDNQTTELTRQLYSYFPDDFDFLALVHPRNIIDGRTPIATAGVYSNNIQGIGLDQLDISALVGSSGNIELFVNIYRDYATDWSNQAPLHEISHRWVAYIREVQGYPIAYGGHWKNYSTFGQGVVDSSLGTTYNEIGVGIYQRNCSEFGSDGAGNYLMKFSQTELYLMGLIPAEDVSPIIYFPDQSPWQCGTQREGVKISIDEIIAEAGPRIPAYPDTQTQFSLATVIFSAGRLLTPDEMSLFNHLAERGERKNAVPRTQNPNVSTNTFFSATGGKASLSTRVMK